MNNTTEMDEGSVNWQYFADLVSDPVIVVNEEFQLVAWNRAASELFRSYVTPSKAKPLEDVMGRKFVNSIKEEIEVTPANERVHLEPELRSAVDGKFQLYIHPAEGEYLMIFVPE